MYRHHWGLQRNPFTTSDSLRFLSDSQREALARMQFLIDNQRRLGLLEGPSGIGKTAILEAAAATQRRAGMPVGCINVLGMDADELIVTLCEQLAVPAKQTRSAVHAWRAIYDRLQTNQYQHLNTTLLFDDIHQAECDVMTAIARLCQWRPSQNARLTVIVTCLQGRSHLIERRLLELCDLHMELAPWSQEDTEAYLRIALEAAGCQRSVFDRAAVESIQMISRGNPRKIVQLADMSLIAGAGQALPRIDAETIAAVQQEFQVPVTPTA